MNAKKIMGAVLVALLVAALFVGAGAAATYFAYEKNVAGSDANSVWKNGANTVTISNGVVGPVAVAGTYTLTTDANKKAYFTVPTATYSAVGDEANTPYIVFNGGTAYKGNDVNVSVVSVGKIKPDKVIVTKPSGAVSIVALVNNAYYVISDVEAGTYKVQALWSDDNAIKNQFTTGAPLPYTDAQSFTFTVISADDATISTAVETIFAGDVVAVTVKGVPGDKYFITSEGINATATKDAGQLVTVNKEATGNVSFTMPNVGEVTLYLVTLGSAEDEVEIELSTSTKDYNNIVIAVVKPTLTATLGASSYFIGETIEVTLSSDGELKNDYVFNITGTNFEETNAGAQPGDEKNVYEIGTATIGGKKVDVGTYTIKIYTNDKKTLLATLPVALKQPFISIVEAPEVIAQGTEAEFTINAEATNVGIQYYVFGTNYFLTGAQDKPVKGISNQFVVTLTKDNTSAKNMSAGQYFAVFQHPMYDGLFNIKATDAGKVSLYPTTNAGTLGSETILFNVSDRQTANAAQALCDALDTQNIDDMYVKYSFFVVGEDQSFTISEIPTEVVKGDKLVISGVSTANAEGTVIVDMISTAFAAVPKETVGSAAFITVSTEIADDGTWEVTLDTSDLNVDEYSLSVALSGADKPWKNINVNVVEGAETPDTPDTPDVPDTPDTPDTPTEPETPGFGALAALAGLGAVAVLLLRRE